MKARLLRRNRKRGQIPGTLESPQDAFPSVIQVFAYDVDDLEERQVHTVEEVKELRKKWPMIWVNVSGLGNAQDIGAIGALFNLHPLAMEDVLHTPQRPKVDEYGDSVCLIVRAVEQDKDSPILDQLSLFWGENFIVSFQERPGDGFGPVRERLRKGGKRTKMIHADYMAYALLDAVIDGFFPVVERYGDQLDELEDAILHKPSQESMKNIHRMKRDLHLLRLCLWPTRDSISRMRSGMDFISEETRLYLRDCQDHTIQILDIVESYRERVSALNDLYLSSVNYRLQEVMKVLTVIATIFMPLSFIASVYGMNFNTSYPYNMPELLSPYGYPAVMGFMGLLALGMLIYFWRLGWLGGKKSF